MRSWRYSAFVDDSEIVKMFVEPGFDDECPADPFEVSDADTMLDWLRGYLADRADRAPQARAA